MTRRLREKAGLLGLSMMGIGLATLAVGTRPGLAYSETLATFGAWIAPVQTNDPQLREKAYYDEYGMPRCIEPDPASHLPSILLYWKSRDRYSRPVFAAKIDEKLHWRVMHSGRPVSQPITLPPSMNLYNGRYSSCNDWPELSQLDEHALQGIFLPEQNGPILGSYATDPRLQSALYQVRRGANYYHAESDAAQFLAHHPIPVFNTEVNRELAARYGMGFTGEIYQAWIIAKPLHAANAEFRESVLEISKTVDQKPDGFLSDVFRKQDRVVVYVKGLGHELKSAERFYVMAEKLGQLGAPIELVDTPSFAPVSDNADRIASELDRVLSQGKKVTLISLSKGSLESLLAVSRLRRKLEGPDRPRNYGTLEAFLSMSGTYGPSFLVGWATEFPQRMVTRYELQHQYAAEKKAEPEIDGLKDMAGEKLVKIQQEIARNTLPQETIYINVVGARGGDGLSSDVAVGPIQNSVIRPLGDLIGNFGANDGYIEYPGTEIQPGLVRHQYTLAVNSSHGIIDGDVAGMSLADPRVVRNFIGAVMLETFQLSAGESSAKSTGIGMKSR